jgi:hypothetical protein
MVALTDHLGVERPLMEGVAPVQEAGVGAGEWVGGGGCFYSESTLTTNDESGCSISIRKSFVWK